MRRFPTLFLSLSLGFAVASTGCGNTGSGNGFVAGDDAGVEEQPDLTVLPDLAPRAYPVGPYGIELGDVIAPISGKGYALTTTKLDRTELTAPDGTLPLVKLWDVIQERNCKCVMVTISAGWCGPCQMEQPDLVSGIDANPDLCVFEIFSEGFKYGSGRNATQVELDRWVDNYGLNFPVVLGSISSDKRLPATGAIPTNAVIDPATMQLVDLWSGYDPDGILKAREACGL